MIRFFLLIGILSIVNFVVAQNTVISEANELYKDGKFEEAINAYELAFKTNIESAEMYYNLGNAYYKTGKIAPAILNYERAKILAPNDKDIAYNLTLAQKHVVDKLDVLPELFLNRWVRSIQNSLLADTWGQLSIIFFIVCLVFASLYLYSNRVDIKKAGFFFSALSLVLCFVFYSFASKQNNLLVHRNQAVVFTPSVTIKGSPDPSGTELFLLHEGTKVTVTDSLGEWRNIQLSDGNEGWLKKEDIEII